MKRQIHCGSRRIGTYLHDIRTDSKYKYLLCGYICIEYTINLTLSNELLTELEENNESELCKHPYIRPYINNSTNKSINKVHASTNSTN